MDGWQRAEDGCQKSEDGAQKTEFESEVGMRERIECVRKRKGHGHRAEDRRGKVECGMI